MNSRVTAQTPKHKGRRTASVATRIPPASVQGETVVNPEYRQDALSYLCERVAMGDSLPDICADDLMPDLRQVMRWLANDESFKTQFIEAQRLRALIESARMQDIADGVDELEEVPRSKLRVDTLKWRLSKYHPETFGDRIEVGHNVAGELAQMLREASNQGHKLPHELKSLP